MSDLIPPEDNDYKNVLHISLKIFFAICAIVCLIIYIITELEFLSMIAGLCILGFATIMVIDYWYG